MISNHFYKRQKNDSGNLFCEGVDLSLEDKSLESCSYYELPSKKTVLDSKVPYVPFLDLQSKKTIQVKSKQKAFRNLVETAAAPYLPISDILL